MEELLREFGVREEVIERLKEEGIRTIEDLRNTPVKVLEENGIPRKIAELILQEADLRFYEEEYRGGGGSADSDDIDLTLPPILVKIVTMIASGGTAVVVLKGRSFSGKTVMALFAGDTVIRPGSETKGGTLSIPGIKEAMSGSRRGVVVDDLQWYRDVGVFGDLARAICENRVIHGPNLQHYQDMDKVVNRIIHERLRVIATWDTSSGGVDISNASWKRILLIPHSVPRIPTPPVLRRWLDSVDTKDCQWLVKSALDASVEWEDSDPFGIAGRYRDWREAEGLPREVHPSISEVINTVAETFSQEFSPEEVTEALTAIHSDAPEDGEVREAWFESVLETLDLALIAATVNGKVTERQRGKALSQVLSAMSLGSLWACHQWRPEVIDDVSEATKTAMELVLPKRYKPGRPVTALTEAIKKKLEERGLL